jgi:hypothetical protein
MSETNLLFEIDGFPKYFVGTDLNFYSEKTGKMKMMRQHIDNQGYYKVRLCRDALYQPTKSVHRLIAKMFIPNPDNLSDVDHINHNKLDNRLENLRWVSSSDNNRNMSIRKKNTSGHQGVSFEKYNNRWAAQWYNIEGKQKNKYFSIKKYGDNAKQLAIDFRQKMVDELYNRVE